MRKVNEFFQTFLFDRTANLHEPKLVFSILGGLSVILFDFELIFSLLFYISFFFLTGHIIYAAPGAALTGGDVLGQPQKFLTNHFG